jgi:DNA-binding transcriptional ArsR family regulator
MIPYHSSFEIEAEIFFALGHSTRLEILNLLRDGEACVCHIQAMLNQRQAYISQHLNILRQAGLVISRKEGLRVYYKISDPALIEVMDCVKKIVQSQGKWQSGLSDKAVQKKPCHCPQCSPQVEDQVSIEVDYA